MVEALEVAKEWGRTPLQVLAGRPGVWRTDDTSLAVALSRYKATRVDSLGFPRRRTEEGDPEGHFEVDLSFNAAKQALDLWEKSDEAKNLAPGYSPRVVDTRLLVGDPGLDE